MITREASISFVPISIIKSSGLNFETLSNILVDNKAEIFSPPIPNSRQVVLLSSNSKFTRSVAFMNVSNRSTKECPSSSTRSISDTLTFYFEGVAYSSDKRTFAKRFSNGAEMDVGYSAIRKRQLNLKYLSSSTMPLPIQLALPYDYWSSCPVWTSS